MEGYIREYAEYVSRQNALIENEKRLKDQIN